MNYLKWPIIAMGMWGLVLEILEHAATSSDRNQDARMPEISFPAVASQASILCIVLGHMLSHKS